MREELYSKRSIHTNIDRDLIIWQLTTTQIFLLIFFLIIHSIPLKSMWRNGYEVWRNGNFFLLKCDESAFQICDEPFRHNRFVMWRIDWRPFSKLLVLPTWIVIDVFLLKEEFKSPLSSSILNYSCSLCPNKSTRK